MKKKLLILIVAFNHEKFIHKVLDRINENLTNIYDVEILINDDSSSDETVKVAKEYIENSNKKFKYTILSNPINQGYGGNQKIGFLYAIKNNFDYVALVHGDGQYAPECLELLVGPFLDDNIDAVFGSRMINKNGAIRGGMPLYKFIGNKILTYYQNRLFNKNFTEFHSGYRIYRVNSLKKIPYELNNNDHSFDNEIILQFLLAELNIKELPIPTYYGEEISYVNGMKYALQVFIANLKAKLQAYGIFYDRKYDCKNNKETKYVLKDQFDSPHSRVLKNIEPNSRVLDMGCNDLSLSKILKRNKSCHVTAVDKGEKTNDVNEIDEYINFDLDNGPPDLDYTKINYILLLDVIEHLKNPEQFLIKLKKKIDKYPNINVIISTPNIGFILIRLMLLLGSFNYGKSGILDKTHTRLFTFSSFKNLLIQNGFKITEISGVPAPLPLVTGNNLLGKSLMKINQFFIFLRKTLFSYQIYSIVRAVTSIELLLEQAETNADKKK
jgi:glycosyltransferase involved in cell wall biosynthesis